MKLLLFYLIFSFIAIKGYNQVKITTAIYSGISYVSKKHVDAQYTPVFSPGADFQLEILLAHKIAATLGIGYIRKGFHDISILKTVRTKTEYIVDTRYHYLSFPLMIAYKAYQNKHLQFWCEGGMNYNFYVKGKLSYQENDYYNDQLIAQTAFTSNVKSGLTYNSYNYKTYGRVSTMDACIRLQMNIIAYNRYTLGFYHDHSLYDLSISGGKSSNIKLRSTGLSAGLAF